MGWWEENDGAVTVGDDPLDFLLDAFEQVVEIYRETMNRSPTLPEWQSLLEGSLFPYIEETSGEQVVVRIERYERSSSQWGRSAEMEEIIAYWATSQKVCDEPWGEGRLLLFVQPAEYRLDACVPT